MLDLIVFHGFGLLIFFFCFIYFFFEQLGSKVFVQN